MVERAWRDGLVADGRSGYVGVGLTAEADLAVEHVLVYIMANVAVGNLYTLNTIVVAEVFYNIRHGF